jgi:hypothetical protein
MSGTGSTGQFWICPKCQRHVPNSVETCRCGSHRTNSTHTPSLPIERKSPNVVPWLGWVCAGVMLAYLVYDRARMGSHTNPQPVGTAPALTTVTVTPPAAKPAAAEPPVISAEQAAVQKEWAALAKGATESPKPAGNADAAVTSTTTSPPVAIPATAIQPQPSPSPQEYVPEERTERYWKQRLFQSRERIRTAYDACTSQFHTGGIGDYGSTQYAAVRGALVSAVSAQGQLEEDARQAGISPGWVRFDWTPYPRLKVADPLSQTGTLTNAHPCSVPDIREAVGS